MPNIKLCMSNIRSGQAKNNPVYAWMEWSQGPSHRSQEAVRCFESQVPCLEVVVSYVGKIKRSGNKRSAEHTQRLPSCHGINTGSVLPGQSDGVVSKLLIDIVRT